MMNEPWNDIGPDDLPVVDQRTLAEKITDAVLEALDIDPETLALRQIIDATEAVEELLPATGVNQALVEALRALVDVGSKAVASGGYAVLIADELESARAALKLAEEGR